MNVLILGYVRITCYAVLYCMNLLISTLLVGDSQKKAKEYADYLLEAQQQIDKELETTYKE